MSVSITEPMVLRIFVMTLSMAVLDVAVTRVGEFTQECLKTVISHIHIVGNWIVFIHFCNPIYARGIVTLYTLLRDNCSTSKQRSKDNKEIWLG